MEDMVVLVKASLCEKLSWAGTGGLMVCGTG